MKWTPQKGNRQCFLHASPSVGKRFRPTGDGRNEFRGSGVATRDSCEAGGGPAQRKVVVDHGVGGWSKVAARPAASGENLAAFGFGAFCQSGTVVKLSRPGIESRVNSRFD